MILHAIEVRNFKAFHGQHQIEFPAPTARRNVYLIGGLNGSGKTSLVHAIMLALLGRSAAGLPGMFQSGRERRRNYEEWLKASFNYEAARSGEDLMSVALTITDDHGRRLAVRRSWWFDGLRHLEEETIEVLPLGRATDGEVMSGEKAEEAISRVFPRNLGELLFFDGEDVRLVEPDGKTIQVEAVIDRLVGLDPLKRLANDLDRLVQSRRVALASPDEQRALDSMMRQTDAALADLRARQARLRELETEKAAADAEIVRLEDLTAATLNSEHPLTVAQVRAQLEDLQRQRLELRQQLARHLGDWLYLLPATRAVSGLLGEVEVSLRKRADAEAEKLQMEAVFSFAERFRERILREDDIPQVFDEVMNELLQAHASAVSDQARVYEFGEFSKLELEQVQGAAARFLSRDLTDVAAAANSLGAVDEAINRLEALRQEFAASSDLERLMIRRSELQELAGSLTAQVDVQRVQVAEAEAAALRARRAVDNLSTMLADDAETLAWVARTERLRAAVLEYVKGARDRALLTLEEHLLAALKNLYRKTQFVRGVAIDRLTYEVRATDRNGEHLAMPSAGEQQLMALGLAQAMLAGSPQTLPFFIDTPLGRLDSEHRRAVVERFLPVVAKQVFVFSTDEEVAGDLVERLGPSIRSRYLIAHDDEIGGSRVLAERYFASEFHG